MTLQEIDLHNDDVSEDVFLLARASVLRGCLRNMPALLFALGSTNVIEDNDLATYNAAGLYALREALIAFGTLRWPSLPWPKANGLVSPRPLTEKYFFPNDCREALQATRSASSMRKLRAVRNTLVENLHVLPEPSDRLSSASYLLDAPLYHEAQSEIRPFQDAAAEKTAFWIGFYEALLEGGPHDSRLWLSVAQIEPEVWEEGADAVAEEIEKIEAKYDLLSRIEDFEGESMAKVSRLGIGGNNPPEEINDPAITREITVIWDLVRDLKEEVQDEAPSKTKIEKLVAHLSASLKSLVRLCGRLGEHALKVVVTLEVTKVFNPELLEAVIEAAKRFLSSGAAG